MKKVLFVAAIAAFSLASCKKDHTCTCTWAGGGSGSVVFPKTTKKKAKDACKAYETTSAGITMTCDLK